MQEFRNHPDGFADLRKQILRTSLPLVLVSIGAGLFIADRNGSLNSSAPAIIVFGLLISAMTIFSMALALKRRRQLYESYRLLIDESGVTREQQHFPSFTIPRSEITAIREGPKGDLFIVGRNKHEVIAISTMIEERERVIAALSQLHPIVPIEIGKARQSTILNNLLTLLTLGATIVAFIAEDKWIATIASIPLIGLLAYSIHQSQKSTLISPGNKRLMFVTLGMCGILIIKMVFLWRE